MTDDELRKLAEAALDKRGPWCGYCGEAFSTREPELARAVLRLLEGLKAKQAECCPGWKAARQHDAECPYMTWARADREVEWRDRAIAAEQERDLWKERAEALLGQETIPPHIWKAQQAVVAAAKAHMANNACNCEQCNDRTRIPLVDAVDALEEAEQA